MTTQRRKHRVRKLARVGRLRIQGGGEDDEYTTAVKAFAKTIQDEVKKVASNATYTANKEMVVETFADTIALKLQDDKLLTLATAHYKEAMSSNDFNLTKKIMEDISNEVFGVNHEDIQPEIDIQSKSDIMATLFEKVKGKLYLTAPAPSVATNNAQYISTIDQHTVNPLLNQSSPNSDQTKTKVSQPSSDFLASAFDGGRKSKRKKSRRTRRRAGRKPN